MINNQMREKISAYLLVYMENKQFKSEKTAAAELMIVNGTIEVMKDEGDFAGMNQDMVIEVFDKLCRERLIKKIDLGIKKIGNVISHTTEINYRYYIDS